MARPTAIPASVNFEVVVAPESGGKSVYRDPGPPTIGNLERYRPPRDKSIVVAQRLQNQGMTIHDIGEFSISASCPTRKFEAFFSTKVSANRPPENTLYPRAYFLFAPGKGEQWAIPKKDGLDQLIDGAYIQHPPLFFSGERPLPPLWKDKFRLRVPIDVSQIMKASPVHRRGYTGKGVRVVMPDTGFYHHPYFQEQGYNFLAVTAPDVTDHTSDSYGHGTGECANLLSTAPGINFVGLKMGNPTLAFKGAVDLRPDVITCSWGYDLDRPGTQMPNYLKPLHLSVLDAVARGITVLFAAGNGHYAFPGSMPEVISVGGVYVDEALIYAATPYTSGFASTWFPGRHTPDVCGLCGIPPAADYILLPVQHNASLEKPGGEGWGAFSGTSAATPMVAGVCAIMKEVDPKLRPSDIKNALQFTARDITVGKNAHNNQAKPGPDGATGYGLADAERAVEALL